MPEMPTDITDMEERAPHGVALGRKEYERELRLLQIELVKLQRWVKEEGRRVCVLFEGRDAAGKGGAIRRFMEYVNPRGARTVALAKPNETERGQWYFQRYVRELPSNGEIVLFDRSWYNRAGVEIVMGFCTPHEYGEFFRQVPELERSLVESGLQLFKFWFTVSRDEQQRRFDRRRTDPLRQWKLSPIDLAALDRFDDYTRARDAMLVQTDSMEAPWIVVNGNEKRRARLESIRAIVHNLPYAHKDEEIAHVPDPLVIQPASAVAHGPQLGSGA
jgi:polyphosphate kinase 2